jgi:hypothetical protein
LYLLRPDAGEQVRGIKERKRGKCYKANEGKEREREIRRQEKNEGV